MKESIETLEMMEQEVMLLKLFTEHMLVEAQHCMAQLTHIEEMQANIDNRLSEIDKFVNKAQ